VSEEIFSLMITIMIGYDEDPLDIASNVLQENGNLERALSLRSTN
jgi:hypothetical protein